MVLESPPALDITDDEALLLEEALLQAVEVLEERRVELDAIRSPYSQGTAQAVTNEQKTIAEEPTISDGQPTPAVEAHSDFKSESTSFEPPESKTEDSDLVAPEPVSASSQYAADWNATSADNIDDAFRRLSDAFDDQSPDVRNSAARALFNLSSDRAASFTRALREGSPARRLRIGQALAASGLAIEAIGNLTGESRDRTYDAFSLLFLMAKAGELQPLLQAIEEYPQIEERLAVVKLLALSGQAEIIPAFRRLAVRGALPSEVRSAIVEALYQISSQTLQTALPGSRVEILPPSKVVIRG